MLLIALHATASEDFHSVQDVECRSELAIKDAGPRGATYTTFGPSSVQEHAAFVLGSAKYTTLAPYRRNRDPLPPCCLPRLRFATTLGRISCPPCIPRPTSSSRSARNPTPTPTTHSPGRQLGAPAPPTPAPPCTPPSASASTSPPSARPCARDRARREAVCWCWCWCWWCGGSSSEGSAVSLPRIMTSGSESLSLPALPRPVPPVPLRTAPLAMACPLLSAARRAEGVYGCCG